jgi:PPE-repeat protein
MNFATLPPEINSGRMYEGPGPGTMSQAVTAWDRLATRLYTAVTDYRAVTSKLAARWEGPASTAMTQAATPYIDWLNAAAAQAEHAATQAAAAVSAHETALAAVVPPPVIDANRALRRSLATTNCLGQTSPVIADVDAEYEQMWARDADAMYAYARASAHASTVTPFTSPPPTNAEPARQDAAVNQASRAWAVTAAPEIISTGYQVISTIPETLQALCSSPLTAFDASLSSVTSSLSKLSSLSAPSDFAISHLNSLNKTAALNKAAALRSLLPNPGGTRGAAFTAGFGRGTSIGTLSVPPGWLMQTMQSPVTVKLQRGWVCRPIRLVEAGEPPGWPLSH